ncbi:MAG: YGL010W-like membrane protein [Bacteroidia bacterium]|jgi:uncharacterized membrane protein YGL010W
MTKLDRLFTEYGESHQNETNQLIHWIFVPLIFLSVIGLLWDVKLGVSLGFLDGESLNAAMIVTALAFAYYLNLSFSISVGMLAVSGAGLLICYLFGNDLPISVWKISLIIFVVSWIMQFVGHKIEGKKPSFFKDLQFFLIGPIWVLAKLYKKLGIKY